MNLEHAIGVLRNLRPQLEARGIEHAGLFGSVGRDEAKATSGINVVVGPSERKMLDLIDLGGVQDMLEQAFAGRAVDLVVMPIQKQALRAAVDRDRVDAF